MDNKIFNDLIVFQLNRKITNLGKNFLVILEDIRDDINNSPDVLYGRARKKVLDQLNDLLREINQDLQKTEIKPKI